MIEAAVTNVIGPAVTADDPDATAYQMVDNRQQVARFLTVELEQFDFQFGNANPLRANLRLFDLRCGR